MTVPVWAPRVPVMSPSPTNAQVAQRVTAAMTTKGMSLKGLADNSGVPRSTLQRNLAGHSPFKIDQLDKLAAALDVRVTDLLPTEDVA